MSVYPTMLQQRKRSTRPTGKHMLYTKANRNNNDDFQKRKHNTNQYRNILKAIAAILLVSYTAILIWTKNNNQSNVIHLEKIDILTTVPLGFTLEVPQNMGALEIYLDHQLVSSINNPVPSDNMYKFNFGTCDISKPGENVLNHAFSLERGQLEDIKSIFLKPGNHIVEIQTRHADSKQLLPYAQKQIKVNTPPQLIIGSQGLQYEDAYNLALKEIGHCIACGNFVAGTGWSQLWTRDTSFASELGAALIHPDVVKKSLLASVETLSKGKSAWLQDKCGHFGGWPNLSDAIVGTRGAWSLYLVDGDKEFLKWAFDITINSLQRAEDEVLDKNSGLFMGCSSFLESNSGYPEKYMNDGELVGRTKALSTNMLYYSGYNLASKMARELGIADQTIIQDLEDKAKLLKATIQKRLWSPSKQNYVYFEDEFGMQVDTTEGLGTSLALLDFEDDERDTAMLVSTHTTEYGITCLWPQFKYSPGFMEWRIPRHYHNGRIWPFVQGYWAMAAAQYKQADLFAHELKGLTALSQKGNTFAEFYQLNGTFPEERRSQLWSATGYISMIYNGVFGIRLDLDGIWFSPMKPIDLFDDSTIHLNNIQYRDMTLNIHLHGQGTSIESFELNQVKKSEPFIKADEKGVFDVDIHLIDQYQMGRD